MQSLGPEDPLEKGMPGRYRMGSVTAVSLWRERFIWSSQHPYVTGPLIAPT